MKNESYAVREVQEILLLLSRTDPSLPAVYPDGIYGKETKIAVRAFQRRAGLDPTGKVDLKTWNALFLAAKEAETLPLPLKVYPACPEGGFVGIGEKSDFVLILQIALQELGILGPEDTPSVTGTFDRETEEAVKEIQRQAGLTPDGRVDPATWNVIAGRYGRESRFPRA